MCTVDKLRNKLYEDFKPHIKMIQELQINDEIKEAAPQLVATKKVTRVRKVLPSLLQENQLEVLAIEPFSKQIRLPDLPPTGALSKRPPVVDDIAYVMKSPVMPWIRAKVCRKSLYLLYKIYFFFTYLA